MRLSEVQKLLNDNDLQYTLSIEPSLRDFYAKKGLRSRAGTDAFYLITIVNPYHSKNIDVIFADDSDDPEFYSLQFGGYWYEMYGIVEEEFPHVMLDQIHGILSGKSWVISAANANKGTWIASGLFYDTNEEEWNDMDSFHRTVIRIKKPQSFWSKIRGRIVCYEIFNWKNYEKIIK